MRAVHTFKKDKANMENYFPSPLFQFRAASVLRARPAARPQGGTQPWAGQDAAASLGDTRSLRRGPLDSDSPAGSPLGRGGKPEHPERLCRYWEKAQTPHRQVHQVGINFFFFFFCFAFSTLSRNNIEGNTVIPGPAARSLEWSPLSAT